MERELQDRKQKMAEIIETSNQSYEQRDTYQMEVAAIEQANRKEQEEFEEQMVELARMLESGSFRSTGLYTSISNILQVSCVKLLHFY